MDAMAPDGPQSGAQERQPLESQPNACDEERESRQPFDRTAFPFGYLARSVDEHGVVNGRTVSKAESGTRDARGSEQRRSLTARLSPGWRGGARMDLGHGSRRLPRAGALRLREEAVDAGRLLQLVHDGLLGNRIQYTIGDPIAE